MTIREESLTGVTNVMPAITTPTSDLTLQVKAKDELTLTKVASSPLMMGCRFPGSIEKCRFTCKTSSS